MRDSVKETHESYGQIDISRYTSNGSQFFGSDIVHNGGITITIRRAEKSISGNREDIFGAGELIQVELSNNQFIDAITSGMNTSGVPCTIKRFNGKTSEYIQYVSDKREKFTNNMTNTHQKYLDRIDEISSMLDGNIGKRKAKEIQHELNILRTHLVSNTNFVMKEFNREMERTVTEAKHSISNYIDHKVHSLGIEGIKKELNISIEAKNE